MKAIVISIFAGKYRLIYLLIFGLLFSNFDCNAMRVRGYIVQNNSDTLYGVVEISKYDFYSKTSVFHGINLEPFFTSVRFKSIDDRRFHDYYPEDISKFGFIYKSNEYIFETFNVETKSILKSDRVNYQFLNLVYRGNLALYRNFIRTTSPSNYISDNSIEYYNYYLYNSYKGLSKVENTKDFESFIDLLLYYDVEQEFLDTISSDIKVDDITTLLIEYDEWKEEI